MKIGKSDRQQQGQFPERAKVKPILFAQNWGWGKFYTLWKINSLFTAFVYTYWNRQMSLFRTVSSYSGWPIENKQFHFLAVATSNLSASGSNRSSKSPSWQELSPTIQYQVCTAEQKKPQTNCEEYMEFPPSMTHISTNQHPNTKGATTIKDWQDLNSICTLSFIWKIHNLLRHRRKKKRQKKPNLKTQQNREKYHLNHGQARVHITLVLERRRDEWDKWDLDFGKKQSKWAVSETK